MNYYLQKAVNSAVTAIALSEVCSSARLLSTSQIPLLSLELQSHALSCISASSLTALLSVILPHGFMDSAFWATNTNHTKDELHFPCCPTSFHNSWVLPRAFLSSNSDSLQEISKKMKVRLTEVICFAVPLVSLHPP